MKTFEPESEWIFVNFPDFFCRGYGVYVDIGCAHPENKSLTDLMRTLQWTGVAIDGNGDYENDWIQAGYGSHFCHALLSDEPRARFAIHENSFTSRISDSPDTDHPERWGIKHIIERDTMPLNSILEQRGIGKIDLLTIDLEGHEFAVLNTLDFEKHSPLFIVSEYVTQGEGTDSRVCQMLLQRGYKVVHMTESNLIFRRK